MSAETIAAEKEARMRACHERNEALRASAKIVRPAGWKIKDAQEVRKKGKGIYTESRTAQMLRERYEEA